MQFNTLQRSAVTCLELTTERKQEIKEKLMTFPLLRPYVVVNPFWIDEGTDEDATESDQSEEEEEDEPEVKRRKNDETGA